MQERFSTHYDNHRKVELSFVDEPVITIQGLADEVDINRIMSRYQVTGLVSHVNRHAPMYGEIRSSDFQEAMETVLLGQAMFDELPSTVRRYFENDPAQFLAFVSDPDNVDELERLGLRKTVVEQVAEIDERPVEPEPAAE